VEIRVGECSLYSNYLVSSSIIFGVGTPRRVARNFDMGGKQQTSLNIEIFNAPYFQSIIHETCICLAFFSWTTVFRFEPENKTSIFIELASLKSLYLVKFQVSTLDESHYLLVKLSCKSACDNLDARSVRYAVCFLQPIFHLIKKSSWPTLFLRFLYLHAFDVHQHIRSIEAE